MPCQRRGNQTNGPMMVRPSIKSTVRASSVRPTDWARASCISTTEELMPALQQSLAMLLNEPGNCIQLHSAEAAGTLPSDRLQPEFCHHLLPPDVDVGRLAPIPPSRDSHGQALPCLPARLTRVIRRL